MKTVHAVITHDKEKQSDHLRAICKTLEGAEKKKELIRADYIKQIGIDNFDKHYSVRIEEMEIKLRDLYEK